MQIKSKTGQQICGLFSGVCLVTYLGVNCINCLHNHDKGKWIDLEAHAHQHVLGIVQSTSSATAQSVTMASAPTSLALSIGIIGLTM